MFRRTQRKTVLVGAEYFYLSAGALTKEFDFAARFLVYGLKMLQTEFRGSPPYIHFNQHHVSSYASQSSSR